MFAEIILQWVLEPNNPTEAVEGENITLRWDYNLTGDTLDRVQWRQEDTPVGKLTSNGPVVFSGYKTRFKIDANEKATLMIFSVARSDKGKYVCQVESNQGDKPIRSVIQLNVLCE